LDVWVGFCQGVDVRHEGAPIARGNSALKLPGDYIGAMIEFYDPSSSTGR
jgi:hypothetical protein